MSIKARMLILHSGSTRRFRTEKVHMSYRKCEENGGENSAVLQCSRCPQWQNHGQDCLLSVSIGTIILALLVSSEQQFHLAAWTPGLSVIWLDSSSRNEFRRIPAFFFFLQWSIREKSFESWKDILLFRNTLNIFILLRIFMCTVWKGEHV